MNISYHYFHYLKNQPSVLGSF